MAGLREEILKLTDPTPKLFDPEDDLNTETVASSGTVENFDEKNDTFQRPTSLRSRTAPLLEDVDPRYVGRKISRKSFENFEEKEHDDEAEQSEADSSMEEESDDDVSDDNLEAFKKQMNSSALDGKENKSENEEDSMDEGESDNDEESVDEEESENEEEMSNSSELANQFSNIDVTSEIEKGKAVESQQEVWNRLCEVRIKLQKLLLITNKLPQHDTIEFFQENGGKEYSEHTKKGQLSLETVLKNLIDLQTRLLDANLETRSLDEKMDVTKKIESDEEIPSETDEESEIVRNEEISTSPRKPLKRKLHPDEFEEHIIKRHSSLVPYRKSIIQKWDERTRLSAGKMSQKSFLAFENSAVKQIEQILQNKSRLIKRTQIKRSLYRVLGKPEAEISQSDEIKGNKLEQDYLLKDHDPEIFDDDDFYRQLLKEIIDSKSAGIDHSLLRKQLEIQRTRGKMKKKVDTKASKGRKIRYDVHPKMVNYMAPLYEHTMSDEARDNLFKSLFGRCQL